MGNRAVITTEDKQIGIYVHWNGGRESVETFLAYCDMKNYRPPETDCYGWARMCQVIGNFFGGSISKLAGGVGQISVSTTAGAYQAKIPGLSKIPVIGSVFFSYGFLTYAAILLAVLLSFFLFRTRNGLNLRAVGENPGTADAAGINVSRYKYLATCIGAGIAGLGGLYFVMEYSGGTWTDNGFGDRGWLAVALVIFAMWKPLNAIWGSILFGALYILYLYIPGLGRSTQEIFKALPYVVTIIVLVVISFRKKKEDQPPEGLGQAYFREER